MTTLEELDAAIHQLSVEAVSSAVIGDRTVTMKNIDELLAWRKVLDSQTAVTRAGAGLRFQGITPVYK